MLFCLQGKLDSYRKLLKDGKELSEEQKVGGVMGYFCALKERLDKFNMSDRCQSYQTHMAAWLRQFEIDRLWSFK